MHIIKRRNAVSKTVPLSMFAAMFVLSLSILPFCYAFAQDDAPAAPKSRVEREVRNLEMLITRFMGNVLSSSASVESMNGLLYRFMRDNPGVVRILRTNANGLAVSDVSAGSPQSAPVRNVSAQRWHQYVAQYKAPYYGVDYDDNSGEVMLFYAWPVMTGPDKSRFSGAFAAMIDLSSQIAMIDDPMAPFQIAFRGRAFFQHEWDDVDYDEEPLEVSGSKELTIRVEKPLPTRRDIPVRARRAPSVEEAAPFRYDDDVTGGGGDYGGGASSAGGKAKRAASGGFAMLLNSAILLLLLAIAVMFAYIILKERFGRKPVSIVTEEQLLYPQPPKDAASRVVVESMTEKETRVQPAVAAPPPPKMPTPVPTPPPPAPPPVVAADKPRKADKGEFEKEQQLLSKMLKLIKEEFVIMDNKIQMLSDRIDKLEKKR